MRTKIGTLTTIAAAGLIALAGCDDDATSPDGEASVTVQLTDADGDVDQAWVQIESITLQGSSEAGPGGSQNLLDEPTDYIDLTTLQAEGATFDLVQDRTVPAGNYGQLRLVVENAAVVTEGGDAFVVGSAAEDLSAQEGLDLSGAGQLQCPSCSQTGIAVNLPGGSLTLEQGSTGLILDFDVAQSFGREAGMSSMWVMRPVITSSELVSSGTVEGQVSLATEATIAECPEGTERSLEDFVPVLISEGDTIRSGHVLENGSYTISFVVPGTYEMGYEPGVVFDANGSTVTLAWDAEEPVDPVTVEEGGTATADFTVNGASCTAEAEG